MAKSKWQSKYEAKLKQFTKNLSIAEERGFIVPSEIKELASVDPQGHYQKQYNVLSRYNLTQIQRESYLISEEGEYLKGNRAIQYALSPKEYDVEPQEQVDDITASLQSAYDSLADSYRETSYSEDDDVLSYEDLSDDIAYNAQDVINSFQNRELKYRVNKAMHDALRKDWQGTIRNMNYALNETIQTLQRGAEIQYKGLSVEDDEEASLFLQEWITLLTYDVRDI